LDERKWVVFAVFVALIIALFVAVNKYWFYPSFKVHVTPPPRYKPPVDRPEIVKIRPFERTMKYITTQRNADGTTTITGRNPFLWKDELKKKEKRQPPPPPPKIVTVPQLGMILVSGGKKRALLGNTLVGEGDSYEGHTVEKIEKDGVILAGDYGRVRLFMPRRSLGPPGAEILTAKNPNLEIQQIPRDSRKGRR